MLHKITKEKTATSSQHTPQNTIPTAMDLMEEIPFKLEAEASE